MPFLDHEPLIRLASFFGVLLLLAGCEIIFPRRPRTMLRRSRWPANIGVAFIDTMVVRLIIPKELRTIERYFRLGITDFKMKLHFFPRFAILASSFQRLRWPKSVRNPAGCERVRFLNSLAATIAAASIS